MTSLKDDIIDKALTFGYGGMSREELGYLYDLCKDRDILELGSHIGQSSYVIASVAKKLDCVDTWIDGCPYLELRQREIYEKQPKGMEYSFDANTKEFINIRKFKGTTVEMYYKVDKYYDIILIDADHSYTGVRNDITLYRNKSDFLLFHDYDSAWEGVNKAVNESNLLMLKKVGHLALTGCRL